MFDKEKLEEIEKRKKEWEAGPLKKSLDRFGIKESPDRFYSPLDIKDHDFLEDVGFPGEYPFTAFIYPSVPSSGMATPAEAYLGVGGGLVRASAYAGYGTPEDTRDFYKDEMMRGGRAGPNFAFDLPSQIGYDSDDPLAAGEVGMTGVAIDSLKDMEIVYEVFVGDHDLDKIATNWTINGLTNIILAMYIALADKRGIPQEKLRGTPQNDILKEFVSRGTYNFPPKPSMRMTRDTIVYCTKHMPLMNHISVSGYHIREAGATIVQTIAFTLANAIAYVQLGVDAGLDVDEFLPRLSVNNLSGGIEMFKEVAQQRAIRRMWARIMKERFGAKNPRSWLYRPGFWASCGNYNAITQRPLNNLTRAIIGGIASTLSGNRPPHVRPYYDEPIGLGWSRESMQLCLDASRIIDDEARLCDVRDPLAGSYYIEALTDEIEKEATELIDKIDAMGGAVAAIEEGFIQQEIARSAYQYQKEIETGERVVVGLNKYIGEYELEVTTPRLAFIYDPEKRAKAEEEKIAGLRELKKNRDNRQVKATLKRLEDAAKDEEANIIPPLVEAAKVYATVGEMCGVLRQVFGEYQPTNL